MMDDEKVTSLTEHKARENKKLRGETKVLTGIVSSIIDITDQNAVAFTVKNGGDEKLFWISTAMQGEDRDYRRPLMGESVKIWFNESAAPLNIAGEQACGVVEIRNISNDSELAAFEWFRNHPDGPK